MKTWLKGGLIGVISLFALKILTIIIDSISQIPYGSLFLEILDEIYLVTTFTFIGIIEWFLIGVIIGLIIQKVRK